MRSIANASTNGRAGCYERPGRAPVCGRFNVSADPMARIFLLLAGLDHPGATAHNVAPTENSWVVLANPERDSDQVPGRAGADSLQIAGASGPNEGERTVREMRWWLTPYWADSLRSKYSMINARAETVQTSRAFREPFARRRCIVPIAGFYEWIKDGKLRFPQHVTAADGECLAVAGIWDRWRGPDGVVESFAIVTTAVHPNLKFLHNRQPVMLTLADAAVWLDPTTPLADAHALTASAIPVDLEVTPLTTTVNSVHNKGPDCLTAAGNPRFVPAAPPKH